MAIRIHNLYTSGKEQTVRIQIKLFFKKQNQKRTQEEKNKHCKVGHTKSK